MILGYYLIRDLTEERGEDCYAVMGQFIEGDELTTHIERENCTLAQARKRLAQLYKTKPPMGMSVEVQRELSE